MLTLSSAPGDLLHPPVEQFLLRAQPWARVGEVDQGMPRGSAAPGKIHLQQQEGAFQPHCSSGS